MHDAPFAHATHDPEALQTMLVPQLVPGERLVPASTQVGAAPEHESVPLWQGFDGVQSPPLVHAPHAPLAEQTIPPPQAVPAGKLLPVSVQLAEPPAQDSIPAWQGLAGAQLAPAVHEVHAPARQTMFAPQDVPSGRLPDAAQTADPPAHEIVPSLQGIEGVHGVPPVQPMSGDPAPQPAHSAN